MSTATQDTHQPFLVATDISTTKLSKKTDHILTFPPFPKTPEGVTITPWKDFKECGIQIFTQGDEEVDGLGIPTVPLRVYHSNDACKSNAKGRRAANGKVSKTKKSNHVRTGAKQEWWEEWEAAEDLRLAGPYDPNTSRIDRIHRVANDFRVGRIFPSPDTKVDYLWDQFRLFCGLLGNTPIWNRTDRPPQKEDPLSDDESDFENDLGTKTDVIVEDQPRFRKPNQRPKSRPPYANYGQDPILVDSDDGVKKLLAQENENKEEKLIVFLNDVDIMTKVYLSSYMRQQGLVWNHRFLEWMPRLLRFFYDFVIRVHALPEYEREFRRGIDIINKGLRELPLTALVSRLLPDEFGLSCTGCWGTKSDSFLPLFFDEDPPITLEHPKSPTNETDTQLVTLNESSEFDVLEINDSMTLEDAVKQTIEDNLDTSILHGDGMELSEWVEDALDGPEVLQGFDPSALPDAWSEQPADWGLVEPHSLIALLGPTALPLTHTTGIVECSMRRIKSFSLPPANFPKSPVSSDNEPEPAAVEVELERRFAKVVLAPWVEWDEGEVPELSRPQILQTSRGPVVTSDDNPQTPSKNVVKPHDPLHDDITILLHVSLFENLEIGMGIAGTWVQIARAEDLDEGKIKKKKGKSKAKPSVRYWYVDEVKVIVPSYWTVSPMYVTQPIDDQISKS